jgi:hypothetical protein
MQMFVLRIPVTLSAVEQIKSGLTKSLPEVKSSHRVEALGRSLGREDSNPEMVNSNPSAPVARFNVSLLSKNMIGAGSEDAPNCAK